MKKMKRYRNFFAGATAGVVALLMAGVFFTGCQKDSEAETTLVLSTGTLAFQTAGGTQSFTVSSNANAWNVTFGFDDWLLVSPTDGVKDGTVSVTASPNTDYMPREATITVSATGAAPQTITVTQVEAPPTLLDQSWRTLSQTAMNSNPTQSWEAGDRYKGQMADGYRNGLGAYRWPTESFYFGEWKNGDRAGYGVYIVGNFDNSVINCPNCKIFVGNYSNGLKEGIGTCYDKNGIRIYHGEFKDDKPVATYPMAVPDYNYTFKITKTNDGNYYLTENYQGKRNGHGIILYQNRDMWYGPWKNGIRDGFGIQVYDAGSLRVGIWIGEKFTQ